MTSEDCPQHNTGDSLDMPAIGKDLAPTQDMIVEGRVGNGSWERINAETTKRIQLERRENKAEIAKARVEAYERGVNEALGTISKLESSIVEIGSRLLERTAEGEPLTRAELETLKLAHKVAESMKDRAIGKPVTKAEVKTQQSILHLIAGIGNAD